LKGPVAATKHSDNQSDSATGVRTGEKHPADRAKNVGCMNAAMTLACAQSRPGISVRDTAQASGTAIATAISDAKLAIKAC